MGPDISNAMSKVSEESDIFSLFDLKRSDNDYEITHNLFIHC